MCSNFEVSKLVVVDMYHIREDRQFLPTIRIQMGFQDSFRSVQVVRVEVGFSILSYFRLSRAFVD